MHRTHPVAMILIHNISELVALLLSAPLPAIRRHLESVDALPLTSCTTATLLAWDRLVLFLFYSLLFNFALRRQIFFIISLFIAFFSTIFLFKLQFFAIF